MSRSAPVLRLGPYERKGRGAHRCPCMELLCAALRFARLPQKRKGCGAHLHTCEKLLRAALRLARLPQKLTALSLLFISALASVPMLEGPLEAQTPAPDLILVNATIYTVNPAFSTAEAAAITSGRFTSVGAG